MFVTQSAVPLSLQRFFEVNVEVTNNSVCRITYKHYKKQGE